VMGIVPGIFESASAQPLEPSSRHAVGQFLRSKAKSLRADAGRYVGVEQTVSECRR
jgi:hypothetical protein